MIALATKTMMAKHVCDHFPSFFTSASSAADSLSVDELGEVLNKVCGWPQVPRETLKHLSAFLARPTYRTALAQKDAAAKANSFASASSTLPVKEPLVDIGLFCGKDGMVDG
jgi:hypothetical protein